MNPPPRLPPQSPRSAAVSRLVVLFVSALVGMAFARAPRMAAADRPLFAYTQMWVANGCFVESVACYDAFHETVGDEPWARVLQWGAREDEAMVAGHAVAVFESEGTLWCWDVNHGWMRLPVSTAERDDADAVAAPILATYPKVSAVYPMLWDGGAQVPAPGPPAGEAGDGAEGLRDAETAAARLARHRPVNLIEVSHFENGQSKTSEAVEFAFGGRLCIYSPEKGTTIFRARGTVWNVHLTLEMVRRIFPGVQEVRSVALPASPP
jgi:hypothetical protein